MPVNEILQFCGDDTGTNLLTQAAYDADAERETGNQPGIARDVLVNKALRQLAFMATALAEAIMTNDGNDVIDPAGNISAGDITALSTRIIALATIPDASTSVKGKAQLATNAEVQTGADALKIVTPAGLNSRTATETRTGIAEIATQAEANAGVDDSRFITPLKLKTIIDALSFTVPDATTSVKGKAALATTLEAQTGTNGDKIITPATLAAVTATDTRKGLIEIATAAEVLAGVASDLALTPANFAGNKDYSQNGYIKLPGGLIIQWGKSGNVPNDGSLTVNFNTAFVTACYSVVMTKEYPLNIQAGGDLQLDTVTTTSFQINNGSNVVAPFYWIAIGK